MKGSRTRADVADTCARFWWPTFCSYPLARPRTVKPLSGRRPFRIVHQLTCRTQARQVSASEGMSATMRLLLVSPPATPPLRLLAIPLHWTQCLSCWNPGFTAVSAVVWLSHRTFCLVATDSAAHVSSSGRRATTRARRAAPQSRDLLRWSATWCVGRGGVRCACGLP